MACEPRVCDNPECGKLTGDFYPVNPKTGKPCRRVLCRGCYEDGVRRGMRPGRKEPKWSQLAAAEIERGRERGEQG